MKNSICILVCSLFFSLLFSESYAHERVVVVPLNSSKIVGVYSQPYQYSKTVVTAISSSSTGLQAQIDSEEVPEGKRLFVQYLSYRIWSEVVQVNPICNARVYTPPYENSVVYPLLMTKTTSGTEEIFTSTPSIMIYADPGQRVGVRCVITVGDDVRQDLAISGYYIDQ